jgi:chromosomal replication initiator protein
MRRRNNPNRVATLVLINQVQAKAARMLGATAKELCSQDQRDAVRIARRIAMYVSRQVSQASYSEIGESFGRSGDSVRTAVLKVHREQSFDHQLARVLERLIAEFTSKL